MDKAVGPDLNRLTQVTLGPFFNLIELIYVYIFKTNK